MNLKIALLQNKKLSAGLTPLANGSIFELITKDNLRSDRFKHILYDVILIDNSVYSHEVFDDIEKYFKFHQETGLAIINSTFTVSKMSPGLRKHLIFFSTEDLDETALHQILKKGYLYKQKVFHHIFNTNIPINEDVHIIGKSRDIRNLNDFIKFIAKSAYTPCLIYGEEGTEKLDVVKMIHAMGQEELTQLRSINCAELTDDQLLAKLFGKENTESEYEKNIRGEIEIAEEGTLVLDNIEKISENVQLRLLAYIETHRFQRIGSINDYNVKTRIVATTTIDFEKLVTSGVFSGELYYHLTAFEITLPPLRHRKKDIVFLTEHFIKLSNEKFGHHVKGLSPDVEKKFFEYNWYGNIEELRLVIERIVLLKKAGNIVLGDLPSDILENISPKAESEILGNCSLRDLEKIHIEKTMLRTKGNKSRAAEILNISRTTLREKLRSFELVH